MTGRPRRAIDSLPAYRPGKDAAQVGAEHGVANAIKLASNETPWGPVPSVAAALTESIGSINRYADYRATELRQRIAQWVGVDDAEVTVGCGSSGILQQLFLTYIGPGDEVVYPWRSFEIYPIFAKLADGKAVTVPLVDHRFDLEAVLEAVGPKTKLVVLANPNNPTGTAFDMASLKVLLSAVGPDVLIVLDEAYREFMDPALGDPIKELFPDHRNLVITRTFSKAQGLAALRVGYAVADQSVIDAIDKAQLPFTVNAMAQVAAVASIAAHDEVMSRVELTKSERDRVADELRSRGWEVPDTQANFVYLSVGEATMNLSSELEKLGLVTRPFAGEGIRITISSPEENDRLLAGLAQVIAAAQASAVSPK